MQQSSGGGIPEYCQARQTHTLDFSKHQADGGVAAINEQCSDALAQNRIRGAVNHKTELWVKTVDGNMQRLEAGDIRAAVTGIIELAQQPQKLNKDQTALAALAALLPSIDGSVTAVCTQVTSSFFNGIDGKAFKAFAGVQSNAGLRVIVDHSQGKVPRVLLEHSERKYQQARTSDTGVSRFLVCPAATGQVVAQEQLLDQIPTGSYLPLTSETITSELIWHNSQDGKFHVRSAPLKQPSIELRSAEVHSLVADQFFMAVNDQYNSMLSSSDTHYQEYSIAVAASAESPAGEFVQQKFADWQAAYAKAAQAVPTTIGEQFPTVDPELPREARLPISLDSSRNIITLYKRGQDDAEFQQIPISAVSPVTPESADQAARLGIFAAINGDPRIFRAIASINQHSMFEASLDIFLNHFRCNDEEFAPAFENQVAAIHIDRAQEPPRLFVKARGDLNTAITFSGQVHRHLPPGAPEGADPLTLGKLNFELDIDYTQDPPQLGPPIFSPEFISGIEGLQFRAATAEELQAKARAQAEAKAKSEPEPAASAAAAAGGYGSSPEEVARAAWERIAPAMTPSFRSSVISSGKNTQAPDSSDPSTDLSSESPRNPTASDGDHSAETHPDSEESKSPATKRRGV